MLYFLLALFLLLSQNTYSEELSNDTLTNFEASFPGDCALGEEREYLTLNNGLKVILVSDPEETKNKVALNVKAGYRDDPEDVPGMAHFLEHMLFLGTISNPSPSTYRDFISKNGGYNNATTYYDSTSYYLRIQPKKLEEALELFSQQFTEPLFSEEYIAKEKKVINAEFQYRKDSVYRQTASVAKHAFFEDHNLSKFGTGNTKSLSAYDDKQLAKKMRSWWQAHYSSDLMSLVVYGPQPISELKTLVKKWFSDIPQRDTSKSYPQLTSKAKVPSIAKARINDDERALLLMFKLPEQNSMQAYEHRKFLEFLLERNLPQTFASSALSRRFASRIYADAASESQDNHYLEVYVNLHYKGGEKYWQVIQQLMQYTEALKSSPLEQWRVDEFNTTNELDWCYHEDTNVKNYARNLNSAPPELAFSKGLMINELDKDIMRALFDSITVENMLAVVVHPDFSGSSESPWYEVEYDVDVLEERRFKNFRPNKEVTFYIGRPEKNPYLPNTITELEDLSSKEVVKLTSISNADAWFAQDTSFNDPRVFYYVDILSDESDSSAKQAANMTLLSSILNHQLKHTRAQAEDANSDVDVVRIPNGIGLYFEGYPESVETLVRDVSSRLKDFTMRDRIFERFHYGWIYYLKDYEEIDPIVQADELMESLIKGPFYSYSEQQAGMRSTRESGVKSALRTLQKRNYIRSLAYGNLNQKAAEDLNNLVLTVFNATEPADTSGFGPVKLPAKVNRVFSESEYDDSVNYVYVQGHNDSTEELANFSLLDRLMSEAFFSELRTEQSLGYAVGADLIRYGGTPGIEFSVQSPYEEPQVLEAKTLEFLNSFKTQLDRLSVDQFAETSSSLVESLRQPAINLDTLALRKWRAIKYEDNNFGYRSDMATHLEGLTKEGFSKWFAQRFVDESRRVASILIDGNEHEVPWSWKRKTSDSHVDDFEDFREDSGR